MHYLLEMIKKLYKFIFKKRVSIYDYETKRQVILKYKAKYNIDVFIETGTFMGDTVFALVNHFNRLYSIELSEELANKAKLRFKAYDHVNIIQGDSSDEIDKITDYKNISTIFWLDGHYSGEFFYNDEYVKTAKGNLNTPVEKELELILKSPVPHVILIDDARLFNGYSDYPTIKRLKEIIKTGIIKYNLSVKGDIIRITPKR